MQSATDSEEDLTRAFIHEATEGKVTIFPCDTTSLADQVKQLSSLCSAMAQTLIVVNKKLDSCEQQLQHLTNATQRDVAGEVVQALTASFLPEMRQLIETQNNAVQMEEASATMRKIKPLIKTMGKRLETIESRDIRMENLYLREKIPFHFQPHHSSGSSAGFLAAMQTKPSVNKN